MSDRKVTGDMMYNAMTAGLQAELAEARAQIEQMQKQIEQMGDCSNCAIIEILAKVKM